MGVVWRDFQFEGFSRPERKVDARKFREIRKNMERKPRPETLVRRRSRISTGSNFEADFKIIQDSDDELVVSNDSGSKFLNLYNKS